MPTKIGIVNKAMILLGQEPIISLDDGRKASRVINAVYDDTRVLLLTEHTWKCATKRAVLSTPLSGVPLFTWQYAYQLPPDFLRIVSMEFLSDDFKVEGKTILSNASSVNLIYVFNLSQEGLFDPQLADTLAARLAWDSALVLTGDPAKVKLMFDTYTTKLNNARFTNAIHTPGDNIETTTWLNARVSGTSIDSDAPPGAVVQ